SLLVQMFWTMQILGDASIALQDPHGALVEYRQARDLLQKLAKLHPHTFSGPWEEFTNHAKTGAALAATGAVDEAIVEYRAAAAVASDIDVMDFEWQFMLADIH